MCTHQISEGTWRSLKVPHRVEMLTLFAGQGHMTKCDSRVSVIELRVLVNDAQQRESFNLQTPDTR